MKAREEDDMLHDRVDFFWAAKDFGMATMNVLQPPSVLPGELLSVNP